MTNTKEILRQETSPPFRQLSGYSNIPLFFNVGGISQTTNATISTGQYYTSTGRPTTSADLYKPLYVRTSGNVISITIGIQSLKLSYVSSGDKKLPLVKPIEAAVGFVENMWVMENKELGIVSTAPTYGDCLRDFEEQVVFVYEEYGSSDDNELTKDALLLKHKILNYVKGSDQDDRNKSKRTHQQSLKERLS